MINAIIVEDEPTAVDALKEELATYCPNIAVIAVCYGFREAVQAIDQLMPAIVFMDMHLGDGTGFNVMEHTAWKGYRTIITTAYEKYAVAAFRTDTVGYLLKPVNGMELLGAVKKALANATPTYPSPLPVSQTAITLPNKVAVQLPKGILLVDTATIIRVEAQGNYSMIYCTNKEKHLSSRTLKHFDDILVPMGFIRIHHAHLINMAHISSIITKDGLHAAMTDGQNIPVSQRKRPQLLSLIESIRV